ncbi:LysR family transcriptional regulator [Vibrio cholerae]|uniref:LysR family transcriptional regulator n=1 Tax=Vibrio cholerae TaxID=666 RepID=UPI003F589ED6
MRRTNHRNLVNVGILSGRIPLISLVQFIAVAEHLNFRHAAKALGISQSSVSARVKALEDNLGVLLFERHARGVRLTDAGRHFMERVTAGVGQNNHPAKTPGGRGTGGHVLPTQAIWVGGKKNSP